MRSPHNGRRFLTCPGVHLAAVSTLTVALLGALAGHARPVHAAEPSAAGHQGFYTEAQALRGRDLFNRHCAACHVVYPSEIAEAQKAGRGFVNGGNRAIMPLGGTFLRKYPSVYYLFQRIRDTMPAWDANSLPESAKLDITAFLLRENGLKPGSDLLTGNVPLMKTMNTEPDFDRLFNGKDLGGFKFVLGLNCRLGPTGCATTDPAPVFSVSDGVLVNNGKIQGYMYTEKQYLHFTLRLEYRYVTPPDWDGDDMLFTGNSGYLLFITDHQAFPRSIEIQGKNQNVLQHLGMGAPIKGSSDAEARQRAVRRLGEWNSVEIVSTAGQVRSSLNGTLISTITEHPFKTAGHIGFQSEGGHIQWRNIRIRTEAE
jgi:mono/diheme cytochrome c family protein